jgi:hypothetical protein
VRRHAIAGLLDEARHLFDALLRDLGFLGRPLEGELRRRAPEALLEVVERLLFGDERLEVLDDRAPRWPLRGRSPSSPSASTKSRL